jgi:hypothetical protein
MICRWSSSRRSPFDNQHIRFLSHAERDWLIGLYLPHVQPMATMSAFQGPRTPEAPQLQWGHGRSTETQQEIAAFDKNLIDKRYVIVGFDGSNFGGSRQIASCTKRWLGLSFRYRYT